MNAALLTVDGAVEEGAKGTKKKRDKVPVYLMVVKSVSWYWYSSVRRGSGDWCWWPRCSGGGGGGA